MNTIFAPATAPLKSGVAVIRISGDRAGEALSALTRTALPRPRLATLLKLYNPQNNSLIDEALILWFKAPASFTGEDIAELHIHGGRAVMAELLAVLSSMPGLAMAQPGEFSRRAFLNGKMDLTEAEGLADLIDAETSTQAKLALRQKQGELGNLYESWRESLLVTLANIEAYIDFPDEEIPAGVVQKVEDGVGELLSSIQKHLGNKSGERLRQGLSVAIIGPPNAGKSTLLNLLARRDVAIVSEHAGTTRDIIEVHLDLGGYPVIIADTAGIRENAGEVEAEGIKRALARAEDADVRIMVLDVSDLDGKAFGTANEPIFALINQDTIIILNKTDLQRTCSLEPISGIMPIQASFKKGRGVEELISALQKFAEEKLAMSSDPLITRERHRTLLNETASCLGQFSLSKDIELAAEDLRRAATSLGNITGRINVEDVLDRVFSSFCIGK